MISRAPSPCCKFDVPWISTRWTVPGTGTSDIVILNDYEVRMKVLCDEVMVDKMNPSRRSMFEEK